MKVNIVQLSIIFLCLYGCGASGQKALKEFNNLKAEVKSNYDTNKKSFSELKSCLALKYIKVIEFKENEKVAVEYKMSDTSKWEKVTANTNDDVIKTLLDKEGIPADYLLNLEKKLGAIKANRIWIIDDYDTEKGVNFKAFEIKYSKQVNDLHFFYKIYDRPLDSIERSHYALQTQDSIGGILDKDVIFYYR